MVPREARRGASFVGCGRYYLHDKQAATAERVSFTHTENLPTNDPHKAMKWMAWTALNAEELKRESGGSLAGRNCEKPVYTFSLSWHPEQDPAKWDMIKAGRQALTALGLTEHETVMIAHNDCDHDHLHVIVNLVHPDTGKVSSVSFSKKKLSLWAEQYEKNQGKIYCDQRVDNNARRAEGEYVKHEEPVHSLKERITALYQTSDTPQAFEQALADNGLRLAQGKRLLLIDETGKIHSLARQIEGAKEKALRSYLATLQLTDADTVRNQMGFTKEPQSEPGKPEPETTEQNEDVAKQTGKEQEEQPANEQESTAPQQLDPANKRQEQDQQDAHEQSDERSSTETPTEIIPETAEEETEDVETEETEDQTAPQPEQPDRNGKKEETQKDPAETSVEESDYWDRDQQDRDWQESIIDAALTDASYKPEFQLTAFPADAARTDQEPPARAENAASALDHQTDHPKAANTNREAKEQTEFTREPVGASRINSLQDRHHADLGRFYTESTTARLRLEQQWDTTYGEQERQARRQLEGLEATLRDSGKLRVYWLKLSGQIPRSAEQEVENLRKTLENIEWRKSEQQRALEAEICRNQQILAAKQEQERKELEATYKAPDRDFPTTLDQTNDEDPDEHEDFGPSY